MFVTPVSYVQSTYNSRALPDKKCAKEFIRTPNAVDTVSFFGSVKANPEFLKNQLRILMTRDIWAEKLAVKMPETPLEKEVLLEILNHRKNLDRYARLTNEKARIMFDMSYFNSLLKENPNHPDLPKLAQELRKRGNLPAVLDTLEKNIEIEKKKNKASISYFKDLDKMTNAYIATRRIKVNALEKYWQKIRKNNINAEKKYNTQELIDIITGKKIPTQAQQTEKVVHVPAKLSKKQLIGSAKAEYEKFLRETINVYRGPEQGRTALKGRELVYNINEENIKEYPDIEKQIHKAFQDVQQKFLRRAALIGDVDIYAVGEIWKEMDKGIIEMKDKIKEIDLLRSQLVKTPNDKECAATIVKAKKELATIKRDWLRALKLGNAYEKMNYEKMKTIGRDKIYDFLVGENKEILRYKELEKICSENSGILPEKVWAEILA